MNDLDKANRHIERKQRKVAAFKQRTQARRRARQQVALVATGMTNGWLR
jgi:hypothetical protein